MTGRPTRFSDVRGQGLVELIVALTVLTIGIGALLTVLTASALSLQRSDQKGTALVLAERQIELYRNLAYDDIRLDQASFAAITPADPYMTAHSSDTNIPDGAVGGQITDTSPGTEPCDDVSPPPECMPVQTVTGPDHRLYQIDTYIHQTTPPGGDYVLTVYVVVRNAQVSTYPILARSASTFSAINTANVTGKSIVKLSFSAPKADITNVAIDPATITATLSGGKNETGTVTFFMLKPPSSPSSPCTGASWTQIGATAVSGDGAYSPPSSPDLTPTTAGTYYWYATYSGDANNKKASAICGASTARMTVQASKWSPTLSVTTTAATGATNTQISASTLTGTLASSSGTTTAAITFMVYGPSGSAPATCTTTPGGLWTTVGTITPSGNGSYNPNAGYTPTTVGTYWWYASFPGDTTNNGANSTCGSSMANTVVTTPPDTFGISNIGAQTVGAQFTIATITAQLYSGGTDTAYTGTKTLTFSGPSTSPKGNAPTYPASVTFVNGVASNVPIKLYTAQTTTLTATQGLITGTSNSFTVAGGPFAGFTVQTVGTQTAGTSFGVTLNTVDAYGNPVSDSTTHTIAWSGPANAPSGKAPDYPSTATSVTFASGVGVATGLTLYKAASTSLTATEGTKTGTSSSFTVSAGSPVTMVFINCTLPSSANTTCAGSPFSTGNNGTLKANVALRDTWSNTASATSALSIAVTSSSTANYTVSPSPVSIGSGGSQSNQFTVTPAQNNPATTTITAQCAGFADITLKVQK